MNNFIAMETYNEEYAGPCEEVTDILLVSTKKAE